MLEVIKSLITGRAIPKASFRSLKCECGRGAIYMRLVGSGKIVSIDFSCVPLNLKILKYDYNTIKVGHWPKESIPDYIKTYGVTNFLALMYCL